LVLRPTPANVSRNAHLDTLAKLVLWPLVSQPAPGSNSENPETAETSTPSASWQDAVGRIGVDWWATIVAGAIAVFAAVNLLPKIPW
ncbi:MAG: hypothetical protein ACRDUX_22725, partial [Mycobacterium sp.]